MFTEGPQGLSVPGRTVGDELTIECSVVEEGWGSLWVIVGGP